jgi:hypothetical protein
VSGSAVLLLLFIVLPIVVAPVVIWLVARQSPELPRALRISELLEHGEPADAELLAWKNKGPFLLDSRPMVACHVVVHGGEELFITQSIPRPVLNKFVKGMTLDIRLSADHTAGAIVLPMD